MFKIFKKDSKPEAQTQPEIQKETKVGAQTKPQPQADTKSDSQIENTKISFEDFIKTEMTIGEIISADKVENADRLLKLKVDFGNEQRQIVSGIAEFYQPEELIGTKCPFVTNLEPRKIRGEESNGMILAAKDKSGNFSILKVDQKIEKGTKIS